MIPMNGKDRKIDTGIRIFVIDRIGDGRPKILCLIRYNLKLHRIGTHGMTTEYSHGFVKC